jgi:hypothetical protein
MMWIYMITDKNNDWQYPMPIYTFKSEGFRNKVLKFLDNKCYDKLDLELDDSKMEDNDFEKWHLCQMYDSKRVCFCELNSIQHNKPKNEYDSFKSKLILFQEVITKEQYEKGEEHYESFYKNRWDKIQNKIHELKKEGLSDGEVNEWINSFPELID